MGRRAIGIIIALAVALFGAFGVVAYAQGADSRAVAGQKTQNVYIAKAEVPMGTSAVQAVAQNLIARQPVVARGVPEGALTDVGASTGALVATSAIMPGEIVLASRFGAPSNMTNTQVIPVGKIAITVSLTNPQSISPLLAPQSHIVIFDTTGGAASGAAGSASATPRLTRILLANVVVIGVGNLIAQPTPSPAATPGSAPAAGAALLVTVAVSPAEGQLLVHEIQAGNLLYGGLLGSDVKVDPNRVVNDASILSH
jgi:pilus assembly protein CpaB